MNEDTMNDVIIDDFMKYLRELVEEIAVSKTNN